MHLDDLTTPALIVDVDAFEHNVHLMASAWPGARLRPHVKAFKSTALAHELDVAGHHGFCCATPREVEGMAAAGLGQDLLLANEVVDVRRLQAMTTGSDARITIAVDSSETIDAAARGGVAEVLIDVNVGMPRCGCTWRYAGQLADEARSKGLAVRGVMGYEGHLMTEADDQAGKVEAAMSKLLQAHEAVGGDVISGGGTGTWATNRVVTELQAGSYTLMDTAYAAAGVPFRQALHVWATVVSVNAKAGYATADAGLKALGMDHGNPTVEAGQVWFCSDEHTVFSAAEDHALPSIGDRVRIAPAHVDPTVAYHEHLQVVRGNEVVDTWPVDLRGW
ncbi:MAG: metal-activated pyridoxal enzyme [Acidimicrobiales bacterium]|nr:metal-activated pyridoxal enzyme [Acidimicrobiales bacterium]